MPPTNMLSLASMTTAAQCPDPECDGELQPAGEGGGRQRCDTCGLTVG
ncbi:hypothetical protein [Mangrovactinospora gilvigrisea]|nr:hypothetical protein [Mangrovactinospora gilvigrisea]